MDEHADLSGQDPLSSAAEGDADPGSAALAEAGTGGRGSALAEDPEQGAPADRGPSFAETGPPPEAADDTPVTDVVPGTDLTAPDAAEERPDGA